MANGNSAQRPSAADFYMRFWEKLEDYHAHKEKMGYAGTALMLTGYLGGALNPPGRNTFTLVVSLVFWFLGHAFVRWQLLNRRGAAFMSVGTRAWLSPASNSTPGDHHTKAGGRFRRFFDRWLFPRDMDIVSVHPFAIVFPKEAVDWWRKYQKEDHKPLWHERLLSVALWLALIAFVCSLMLDP